MRFRFLGSQFNHQGRSYKKGDIIKSNKRLDEIFVNCFQLMDEVVPDDEEPVRPKRKQEVVEEEEEEEEEDTQDLGVDVTDQFPKAQEADLLVFKRDKKFYVADADDPDECLSSDRGMNKKETNEFIKGFIKE